MNHTDLFLQKLKSAADPEDAKKMTAYHKAKRVCLGVRVPQIAALAGAAAKELSEGELLALCDGLWGLNIHETRIGVGKIIASKKIKNLNALWEKIRVYKDDLDAWAVADHLKEGAGRCLKDNTACIDEVEGWWLKDGNFWVRRAALVYTLCFSKRGKDPERFLGWAAFMVDDREWFIQKAVAWWLRELSKHNPERVREFLVFHGKRMKPFAVKEASKYL